MNTIVYNPVVSNTKDIKPFEYAPRPATLKGKRLALIDSSKVNADLFLSRLEELFSAHGIAHSLRVRKLTPGLTLTGEQLAEIKDKADIAVVAFGD
jgi:hypothetical protein